MVFSLETLINKCKLLDLIGRVMMICWLLMSEEHKLNANIKCCVFKYFLITTSLVIVMIMLVIIFLNHLNISWITSRLFTVCFYISMYFRLSFLCFLSRLSFLCILQNLLAFFVRLMHWYVTRPHKLVDTDWRISTHHQSFVKEKRERE